MSTSLIPMVALSRHRYRDKWVLEGEPFFAASEEDADELTGIRPPIARHITPQERSKLATVQNAATIAPTASATVRPQQHAVSTGQTRPTLGIKKR